MGDCSKSVRRQEREKEIGKKWMLGVGSAGSDGILTSCSSLQKHICKVHSAHLHTFLRLSLSPSS